MGVDTFALCRKGESTALENAIRNGGHALVNERDAEGNTPLHIAVEAPRNEIGTMAVLLDNKADVNAMNDLLAIPLHYAALRKHNWRAVITLLIEHGATIDAITATSKTPLFFACEMNRKEAIETYLCYQADRTKVDAEGNTVFHALLRTEGRDMIKLECLDVLVANDPNEDILNRNASPIMNANMENFTPAHYCCIQNLPRCLARLMEWKVDINRRGGKNNDTCLHLACLHGHAEMLQTIIHYEPLQLDAQNNERNTALHICAMGGRIECASALVNFGANTSFRNIEKKTAYDIAKKKTSMGLGGGAPEDFCGDDKQKIANFLKDTPKKYFDGGACKPQ